MRSSRRNFNTGSLIWSFITLWVILAAVAAGYKKKEPDSSWGITDELKLAGYADAAVVGFAFVSSCIERLKGNDAINLSYAAGGAFGFSTVNAALALGGILGYAVNSDSYAISDINRGAIIFALLACSVLCANACCSSPTEESRHLLEGGHAAVNSDPASTVSDAGTVGDDDDTETDDEGSEIELRQHN